MLARLEHTAKQVIADSAPYATLPAVAFQIEKIVNEDRFAFLQEEAIAAEAATESHDHALRTAFRNGDRGGDSVVLVEKAGSISDGNVRILTQVGENRSPGSRARPRRNDAWDERVIQWADVVLRRLRLE